MKPPPHGILKLNFDGSFIKEEHKRGFGGVIRDSLGQVLCNLSGPADCDDANRAEVYAMLIGCHELRKLEATNAMVEGDSFSPIQCGLGKSKHP